MVFPVFVSESVQIYEMFAVELVFVSESAQRKKTAGSCPVFRSWICTNKEKALVVFPRLFPSPESAQIKDLLVVFLVSVPQPAQVKKMLVVFPVFCS